MAIHNISAVFFDMDGTLVDSEPLTEPTIKSLCHEGGIDAHEFDYSAFFGVSWLGIEQGLIESYPQLAKQQNIPLRLHNIYHRMLQENPPPLIRMSRESVIAANEVMPTAIVSSSGRETIEETIRRMDITENVSYYAGFEDYERPKPAPDGYLKAADVLQVSPYECLVFEDSIIGIRAAKSAGMKVVAITYRSNDIDLATELADLAVTDFSSLRDQFFREIKKRV